MKKRVFIAIPISNNLKNKIFKIQQTIKNNNFRIVDKENLHITLRFLGNIEENEIKKVMGIIEKAAKILSPFSLQMQKIEFTPSKNPRLLWLKFEESKEFKDLLKLLQNKLNTNPKTPQTPHITLARIKKHNVDFTNPPQITLESVKVEQIDLIASQLTPNGPIYTLLKSFTLNVNNNKSNNVLI